MAPLAPRPGEGGFLFGRQTEPAGGGFNLGGGALCLGGFLLFSITAMFTAPASFIHQTVPWQALLTLLEQQQLAAGEAPHTESPGRRNSASHILPLGVVSEHCYCRMETDLCARIAVYVLHSMYKPLKFCLPNNKFSPFASSYSLLEKDRSWHKGVLF